MADQTARGLDARKAALTLIAEALSGRGDFDRSLAGALHGLEGADRAFARSLAMITLRRLGQIDRALGERLQKPPPEAVAALLRLGAAQVLFMEAADYAAVDTTLRLAAKDSATRPFKGLINAVLRGMVRQPPVLREADLAPDWILARWRAAYGPDAAGAIAAQIAAEPPTDLTLRDSSEAPALAKALDGAVLPGGGGVRTARRGDITAWPGYAEGRWWVQDAAAAIPARLVNAPKGGAVLDLCAAPGGKTMQLAAAGFAVTALDRSSARLRRLGENLARTGLDAEVVASPAETWEDGRLFDFVLLDAPCSASGTFRRQPEVLWLMRPPEVAKLALVQARLLDAAAKRVRPGGFLVYCVCSLEPEEGESQAHAFLSRHVDFAVAPIAPGEGGAPEQSLTPQGTLRLAPHHLPGGQDGFFVARFQRSE